MLQLLLLFKLLIQDNISAVDENTPARIKQDWDWGGMAWLAWRSSRMAILSHGDPFVN